MLAQDQLDFYQENGYLHVKGLFTREEADSFRQEAHALIETNTARGKIVLEGF